MHDALRVWTRWDGRRDDDPRLDDGHPERALTQLGKGSDSQLRRASGASGRREGSVAREAATKDITIRGAKFGGLTPSGDLSTGPQVIDRQTVAILPFKNMSSDPENEYFADGITEELIVALSTIDRIKVISRTSAMQYKASTKGVLDIARELAADTLVEGSVRKATNRVRISVQLIDGRDEGHLWAQTYDRQLDDIFAVQSEIAEKVVEALRVKLLESERRSLRKSPTSSPEAYNLYLKGRYHLTRYSEPEVRKAAELFEQATKLDERFASAYAMSAQCAMLLGFFGFVTPGEGFEKARPLLRRAIEIDDHLDTAHMLMGRLLMDADWDWSGAEAEFKRAIEMSPNSAEAHYRYALLLINLMRNAEALAEIKTAEELDPLSVAVSQVAGSILYIAGRNGEAIERLGRAIEIDPGAASRTTILVSPSAKEASSTEAWTRSRRQCSSTRTT